MTVESPLTKHYQPAMWLPHTKTLCSSFCNDLFIESIYIYLIFTLKYVRLQLHLLKAHTICVDNTPDHFKTGKEKLHCILPPFDNLVFKG